MPMPKDTCSSSGIRKAKEFQVSPTLIRVVPRKPVPIASLTIHHLEPIITNLLEEVALGYAALSRTEAAVAVIPYKKNTTAPIVHRSGSGTR